MKKTKSKNKRLISKIVTVVCLVATLVAVMVVPSFAYTIDNNSGSYSSQKFEYLLDRSAVITGGYETCYHGAHVTRTYAIPVSEIENYSNSCIYVSISGGEGFKTGYVFSSVHSLSGTGHYVIEDKTWGDEHFKSRLIIEYVGEEHHLADEFNYVEHLLFTVTMHAISGLNVNDYYLSSEKYYGDGGTLRIYFTPNISAYSDTIKTSLKNKNETIVQLNSTIVEKDNAYNDMVAQKDQAYNDMLNAKGDELALKIAEKDKVIADLNDNVAKNGALRSLFNGIGDGISKLIEPFLGLEFNGITIGSVIAFIVVVIIVFIVLKFII